MSAPVTKAPSRLMALLARLAGVLALLAPGVLAAHTYLKIGSISGDPDDPVYEEWITVEAFETLVWREGPPPLPPFFGHLGLSKPIDKATPLLALACARGDRLGEVLLEQTRQTAAGAVRFYQLRLQGVEVVAFHSQGGGGGADTMERVELTYERIDTHYRQLSPDGTVISEAGAYWDLLLNSGGEVDPSGNTAPVIQQAAEQSVAPGETRTIGILINDLETPLDELTLAVETSRPDLVEDLVLGGSGGTRTLTFTASALFSGSASVTVTVSDGELSQSMAFSVLIDVEMTPYEAFLAAYFTEAELLANPELASPIGDPDGDGLITLLEFHLGTNPREFTRQDEAVQMRVDTADGSYRIELEFNRRTDDPNVTGRFWGSSDLKDWTPLSAGGPLYEETGGGGTNPLFERVSATVTPPGGGTYFLRYQVELQ